MNLQFEAARELHAFFLSNNISYCIIVSMKTLASPQIAGSTIGEGSMKTVNTGTVVPLEKCPFRAFPSRTLCVRLLTGGIALQHWGEPRFTQDVDATLLIAADEESKLIEKIFSTFKPRITDAFEFTLKNRVCLVSSLIHCRGAEIAERKFNRRHTQIDADDFTAETQRSQRGEYFIVPKYRNNKSTQCFAWK